MNREFYNLFAVQPEKLVAPMQRFSELSLRSGEKLLAMQLEITRSYVHLGVEQLKALLEVKDAESLRAFINAQADAAKNLGDKMMADAKMMADLGVEYNAETQKLAQEGLRVAGFGAA